MFQLNRQEISNLRLRLQSRKEVYAMRNRSLFMYTRSCCTIYPVPSPDSQVHHKFQHQLRASIIRYVLTFSGNLGSVHLCRPGSLVSGRFVVFFFFFFFGVDFYCVRIRRIHVTHYCTASSEVWLSGRFGDGRL